MNELKISLAAARVNAKMTQKEAADAICVSKNTIVNWENGHSEPDISQARAISEIYKIPLDNIFF